MQIACAMVMADEMPEIPMVVKGDDMAETPSQQDNSTCLNPDVCMMTGDRIHSYMSVHVLENMYLMNATILNSTTTDKIHECQKCCLLTAGCRSMEMNKDTRECNVLAEDMYSNASMVEKSNDTDGSILHLAIKVFLYLKMNF